MSKFYLMNKYVTLTLRTAETSMAKLLSEYNSNERYIEQMAEDFNRLARAIMTNAEFVPVDLTEMVDNGVLMIANEQFFWPLGLALTWTMEEDGTASDLHIRQWDYGDDDYHEMIVLDKTDEIGLKRHEAFDEWINTRIKSLPEDERDQATALLLRAVIKHGELRIS